MKSLKKSALRRNQSLFDGIEIGAVAWQVMNFEMMPIQSLSFMPTGIVDDEQSAFGIQRGDFLGQII